MPGAPVVLALLLAAGCGEGGAPGRAPVPPAGEEEETPAAGVASGPLMLSPDGRAVLLSRDTLFTADRLPPRDPGGLPVESAGFGDLALSPDGTLVAFTTAGTEPVLGIWSRTLQTARLVDRLPRGIDTMAWAPQGQLLAWSAKAPDGIQRVAMADAAGRRVRHPIVDWLVRHGRSARLGGWIDSGRLRVMVADDPSATEELPHVWDVRGGWFTVEEHIEPLSERAPAARPDPGGVFSLDLTGDSFPETVALFRNADGAPAALLLEGRWGSHRAHSTAPLMEAADLGLEAWSDGSGGLRLYAPARLASGTAVLLQLPSPRSGVAAIGVFRVAAGGGLEAFRMSTPSGDVTAVFFDGRTRGESYQLGLVDLDQDGFTEVVSAMGRIQIEAGSTSVRWRATALRGRGGRLVVAPDLESAALARIAEATGR